MGNYTPKKFSKRDEEKINKGKNLHIGKRSEEYPELTEIEVEYGRRNGSRKGLSREEAERQIKETNDALRKARLKD